MDDLSMPTGGFWVVPAALLSESDGLAHWTKSQHALRTLCEKKVVRYPRPIRNIQEERCQDCMTLKNKEIATP